MQNLELPIEDVMSVFTDSRKAAVVPITDAELDFRIELLAVLPPDPPAVNMPPPPPAPTSH